MKRWLGPVALFAVAAIAAHWLAIGYAPRAMMGIALHKMEARGIPLARFVLASRVTPQTQTVVRPSPDLAYSICRFDFAANPRPLHVAMAPYDGYASLSLFDARTDNFLTLRGDGRGRTITLVAPGKGRAGTVASPTTRGLILIRRLAPSESDYARVVKLAPHDRCTQQ